MPILRQEAPTEPPARVGSSLPLELFWASLSAGHPGMEQRGAAAVR
ncbi:MAG: hypothetical protein QOE92_337, partial [Chloroflexota bacterium]|nr:hypothetical protein [Chloroflexota bacterium]